MVHTIGNPVELCQPQIVSQTPQFLQYAISSSSVVEPCQHPCLNILPALYLKAIKGVASQVDAFLGMLVSKPASLKWFELKSKLSDLFLTNYCVKVSFSSYRQSRLHNTRGDIYIHLDAVSYTRGLSHLLKFSLLNELW